MSDLELLVDGARDAAITVVLAHGAGAPMDSPFMEHMAGGLAAAGLRAVRFEFPYMRARREGGRRGPDRPAVLHETWRAAVEAVGEPADLVIGGKSLGGRIAAALADELGVRGVVCLGYPFHPPGKPDKLRTAALEATKTPTLIVQGTRDPFGRQDEVKGYGLSANVRVFWSEDGDHSLKPRVRSGRTLEQNLAEALDEVVRFARALLAPALLAPAPLAPGASSRTRAAATRVPAGRIACAAWTRPGSPSRSWSGAIPLRPPSC